MNKLLDKSLKQLMLYASLVLVCSIPLYYLAISKLWEYELDEHNIILSVEAGREDSFLIISAVVSLTVFFFILLLGGFVLLNRKISRRLWQPFYNSLDQIRDFDLSSQEEIAFGQTGIAEFEELNQRLAKLIAGNIAVYNQQKEFAQNASHELQTPLAIVQSKLEILLQGHSLTKEQYDQIEEALQALVRVNRINKNLLLLTKIENSQFMDKESIDLSELVKNMIPQFANFSEVKNMRLQAEVTPGIEVKGNKILIEILLNNLITNSIRHSSGNSLISVRLSPNGFDIANAGTEPLEPTRLFQRFSSASAQTPGTGLGLALVKQICSRYGWDVQYFFANNFHHFSLQF